MCTTSDSTIASIWRRAASEFVGDDTGRSVTIAGGRTRVSVAGDARRPGASVLKLAIAIAVHEFGPEILVTRVALADLPTSRWPSILDALAPAHELTLQELAGIMLVASDNRAAEHLLSVLGHERVNATLLAHGCTRSRLDAGFGDEMLSGRGRANVATTDECANLLASVHHEERLEPVLTALRANLNHTRIQLRLPDEVIVAHKTGSLRGVINDVGLIYAGPSPLTICFLTDEQPDAAATAADIGLCTLRAYTAWTEAKS